MFRPVPVPASLPEYNSTRAAGLQVLQVDVHHVEGNSAESGRAWKGLTAVYSRGAAAALGASDRQEGACHGGGHSLQVH